MNLPESLNPHARSVVTRLISIHPEFGAAVEPLDGGHFEASIQAPVGSQAGALVICTAKDRDIWLHFAPAQMWYSVDNEEEMLEIVDLLFRDELLFVRTVDADGAWSGTTLVRRVEAVDVQGGETATVMSWSGLRDDVVRATE